MNCVDRMLEKCGTEIEGGGGGGGDLKLGWVVDLTGKFKQKFIATSPSKQKFEDK